MMRSARNTPSPFGNHARRIDVSIVGKTTMPASKRLTVPLSWLDMPARRTSSAGVGRAYHLDSNAVNRCKQEYSFPEEPGRVLLPANQTFRVFKCYASARLLRHGHNGASFTGQHLPLRTYLPRFVNAVLLQGSTTITGTFQYRSQVGTLVAIGSGNGRPDPNIAADKLFRFLDFRQWHLDRNADIPLMVLPKDFSLLTQRSTRKGQRAIDAAMLTGWDVEFSDALHHHPQIKARGFAWGLDVGCVNEFSLERPRLMSGFAGPSPIGECATIGTTNKLTHAFRRGASGLLTKHGCAFRVKPRKESRQERQRISLIGRREQFQLVTESYGMHEEQYSKPAPQCKVSFASTVDDQRPPETALRGPMQIERVLTRQFNLKGTVIWVLRQWLRVWHCQHWLASHRECLLWQLLLFLELARSGLGQWVF